MKYPRIKFSSLGVGDSCTAGDHRTGRTVGSLTENGVLLHSGTIGGSLLGAGAKLDNLRTKILS